MKKLIAAFAFFIGLNVNASVITIELSDTNVAVGETVTVNLVASGFDFFDTFDFDFDFDTSVFSYDPSSLVSDLSAGILEVNQVVDGIALSFFDFTAYNGDFLLASFDLVATNAGPSGFSFSDVDFLDSFFGNVLAVNVDDTQNAAVTDVSAPATLSLLAMALVAFAGFRRKA